MATMMSMDTEHSCRPNYQPSDTWQAMLEGAFGAWRLNKPVGAAFNARLHRHGAGAFQIVDCLCDPCDATRSRSDVARDMRETLTIQLVQSGREHFTIEGRDVDLQAGDILIWNSTRPMSFRVEERLHKVSVSLPLSRLRGWLPGRWHQVESKLPRASPGATILSSLISSITPAFLNGALPNSEGLTEAVLGLLVNVTGLDTDPNAAGLRATQLVLAKRHIQEHLDDPDLSPATVASARRISLRYLHALFETEEQTVQQYIIKQRLQRCRRDLGNAATATRTITDIAFSWGFQNSAHFSRRFKEEFGVTPQAFRSDLIPRNDTVFAS